MERRIAETYSDHPLVTEATEEFDKVREKWSSAIRAYLISTAMVWQKKHPKRTVRWLDAMGVYGFQVDGNWVTGDSIHLKHRDPRWQTLFKDLNEVSELYCYIQSYVDEDIYVAVFTIEGTK